MRPGDHILRPSFCCHDLLFRRSTATCDTEYIFWIGCDVVTTFFSGAVLLLKYPTRNLKRMSCCHDLLFRRSTATKPQWQFPDAELELSRPSFPAQYCYGGKKHEQIPGNNGCHDLLFRRSTATRQTELIPARYLSCHDLLFRRSTATRRGTSGYIPIG